MKAARWIFRLAGMYGLLVTLPLYFQETYMGQNYPPPVNHPEYYYGFTGVTLAFQVLFLVLAQDPIRYRPIMPVAVLEKFSYALAVMILFGQGRVGSFIFTFGMIDLALGVLFCIAYWLTRPK